MSSASWVELWPQTHFICRCGMLSPTTLGPGGCQAQQLSAADTHFFTCSSASGSRRHAARSKATESSAVASVRTSGVYPTRIPLQGKHTPLGQHCQPWGANSKFLDKLLMPHLLWVSTVPWTKDIPLGPSSKDSPQPELGWDSPSLFSPPTGVGLEVTLPLP